MMCTKVHLSSDFLENLKMSIFLYGIKIKDLFKIWMTRRYDEDIFEEMVHRQPFITYKNMGILCHSRKSDLDILLYVSNI